MNTIYMGCDPGKDGYITAYDGKEYTFYAMPTMKVPNGKLTKKGKPCMKSVFDMGGFPDLIDQIKNDFPDCIFKVALEEVGGRGRWGATKNFNFGHTAGAQRMIFLMLGAEIIMVRPQKWQSVVRRGYNLKKVPSSTGKTMVVDSKAAAEHIATTEFPDIDFRKTTRATKNHDGKIDSFLICQYLIRKHEK